MNSKNLRNGFYLVFIFIFIMFLAIETRALNSGSSSNANLSIYDNSETESGGFIKLSGNNITFYANFTNSSVKNINASNGNALCQIRFNATGVFGAFSNMTYDIPSFLFNYSTSFN